jgi:two-component system sensor histidine kinase KdpD
MLERVVANIAENAVKYAAGSDVVLTARAGAGITVGDTPASELRIADHGKGVGQAEVLEMFQPFQRLDDSAGGGPGVGLGLAVAKGFTEAMGGTLRAEPTPGGGLTMVVTLPLWTGHQEGME